MLWPLEESYGRVGLMPRFRVTVWRTYDTPTRYRIDAPTELEAKKEAERQDIIIWGHSKGISRVVAKSMEPNPLAGGRHEDI